MKPWSLLALLGLTAAPFVGCGPDHRPEQPCEGPSFELELRAKDAPLPADTRINVRYGGNPEGEPYELGSLRKPQAVRCSEAAGGAGSEALGGGGVGGSHDVDADSDVFLLSCRLFTQGPAQLDVTASGYEPISNAELSFERERHCEVKRKFVLVPLELDAGM